MVTVCAALALVIALTAGSLGSNGSGGRTATGKEAGPSKQAEPGDRPGDTRPTTTLIFGRTTLFVATTTPYTTTSSTSTTTTVPAKDTLSVRPTRLSFAPGSGSTSFTVRTTSKSAVTFFVVGVPRGMVANPVTGRVTRTDPAKVALILTDPNRARSGVLTVVGTDGSEVRVPVEIARSPFAVGSVTIQPSPVRCNAPARISVGITGDDASQVSVTLDQQGSSLSLTSMGDGSWQGILPAAPQGTSVAGTVTATSGSGETAQQRFAYTVVGGPGC